MVKVIVSKVCGLCAGSRLAIDKTRECAKNKNNVVLFKEILHNKNVLLELAKYGVRVKETLHEIDSSDYVIVRAHGEPKSTFDYFQNNKVEYLDCTCPNVKVINKLVNEKDNEGFKIIIVGKYGFGGKPMHPEVQGTAGWCTDPLFIEDESEIELLDMSFDKYFLVVQTTFSKDKADKFIELIKSKMQENNKIFEYKNTICFAQKNINITSCELAKEVDVMIVIGGKNSSNTKELYNSLKEIKTSFHIEDENELQKLIEEKLINSNMIIGLTAGASTMQEDIDNIKNIIEAQLS